MKKQWILEAERYAKDLAECYAKDLAERIYEQIAEEAKYLDIDKKLYFEKVVCYMRAESEGKE